MTVTAYDDVTVDLIPADAQYVFYYVDGTYANGTAMKARFPDAVLAGIAVNPADDADVLDVETGDATIADIYAWLKRQLANRKYRATSVPVIYTSVSNVDQMMLTMDANGFKHGSEYKIWSAHYTGTAHICSPTTCKATSYICDATQWTDTADGKSLDQSLVNTGFFAGKPVTPKPAPAPAPAPKPAVSTVTLTINGTKIVLDAGKSYTLEVS